MYPRTHRIRALFLALGTIAATLFVSAPAAQAYEPVDIVHTEKVKVDPYNLTVGFSRWPLRAEQSLDFAFAPDGGIKGRSGTLPMTAPGQEAGGAGGFGGMGSQLSRHPRKLSVWGLDVQSLPTESKWSFTFTIKGSQSQGTGTLSDITALAQPGPPKAVALEYGRRVARHGTPIDDSRRQVFGERRGRRPVGDGRVRVRDRAPRDVTVMNLIELHRIRGAGRSMSGALRAAEAGTEKPGTRINRADLARFLLDTLEKDTWIRKASPSSGTHHATPPAPHPCRPQQLSVERHLVADLVHLAGSGLGFPEPEVAGHDGCPGTDQAEDGDGGKDRERHRPAPPASDERDADKALTSSFTETLPPGRSRLARRPHPSGP
ncbi:hypothetical protein ACIBAG_19535 [Streptomyces sp. NPDC051243]|uniref:hypothetical protein n=1 Tax=Streptomyces sp. NPDC051243 TaxID=3365646 RepID=UPI00378A9F1B